MRFVFQNYKKNKKIVQFSFFEQQVWFSISSAASPVEPHARHPMVDKLALSELAVS
jgi:hypothetical protein